jgi:hypothetical protein
MIRNLTLVAAFMGCATILSAQVIDPDTFKVNYITETNNTTVYLTNVGTTAHQDLCADIYVSDANQELAECCSCKITPDGLLAISSNNLVLNTLTGEPLALSTIKIISAATTGGYCPNFATPKPEPGIRGWATQIQPIGALTQSSFQDAGLSAAELMALTNQCKAIGLDGSGKGVCSCQNEVPGL